VQATEAELELELSVGQQPNRFIYLVTVIAALGGFLFGYDTGIISGALMFVRQTFPVSTVVAEIIVSSVVFGALFGAIISGRLADNYGRRRMLIVASIMFIVGTLIASLAPEVSWLIFGRFILGLAIGVSSYTTPLFISEIAPLERRGRLVLLNAIMITSGETIAFIVDYALVPTHSWRLMFITGLIPAVLLLIGMWYMPATPRWMMLKGMVDKARVNLAKIRGRRNVDHEIKAIQRTLELEQGSWRDLINKRLISVLVIGLGLGVLQQFVGINTVMYYGPTIFREAGFHSASAQVFATFIMGVVNVLFSLVALLLVDRIGRRKLLIYGLTLAAVSLALLGYNLHHETSSTLSHWLTLVLLITYIAGYCVSLGSLFWLIIAEIYPLNIRGVAMSFVAAIQWGANFIVAATFLSIIHLLGMASTFWLYGVMCIIALAFCYFLVPETKGISLEQIEDNLHQGKRWRRLGK